MNFFITKGQCRVCGRILCCLNHQREHERLEHREYIYLLDKLPITCKNCCRSIRSVCDLHCSCHPYMNQRLMDGNFNNSVMLFKKPNRKRTLNQARKLNSDIQLVALPHNEREKLVPVYKFRRMNIKKLIAHAENGQQTLLIELNQILIDSSSSVFSPQLNISYRMLINSIVKSSTPLNEEEKENALPIVDENSKQNKNAHRSSRFTAENASSIVDENFMQNKNVHISPDLTVYKSAELYKSPAIVISAKKNTPAGIMSNSSKRPSKKVLKNRRVTFELAKRTESEQNFTIYSTPNTTMEMSENINDCGESDFTIITNSPSKYDYVVLNIVKKVMSAINNIPRNIFTAWHWSNQKVEKSQSHDEKYDCEIQSPLKKRPKYETADSLVRKPITSYWVNMSVNSLFRKPLPNYVHKLYDNEENYY